LCVLGLGIAAWVSSASADDPKGTDETQSMNKSMKMMKKKTATAEVVSVDTAKRHVVVKDDNGNQMTIEVPESVKRLDEVKPGDTIKVDYYRSLALSMKQPGEAMKPGETQTFTERNEGKLPSGTVAHTESGTVEIVKIDKDKNQVQVKRPNGDIDTIDVTDPAMQSKLSSLKEGDKVNATYTEAAAISVQRENKGATNQPSEKEKPQGNM
jgi:hypothetical protein